MRASKEDESRGKGLDLDLRSEEEKEEQGRMASSRRPSRARSLSIVDDGVESATKEEEMRR